MPMTFTCCRVITALEWIFLPWKLSEQRKPSESTIGWSNAPQKFSILGCKTILHPDIQILPSKYSKMNAVKILMKNWNYGAGDEIRTHDIYLGKISVR